MVAFEVRYSCVRLGALRSATLRGAASDRHGDGHAECRGFRVSALWPDFGAQGLLLAPALSPDAAADRSRLNHGYPPWLSHGGSRPRRWRRSGRPAPPPQPAGHAWLEPGGGPDASKAGPAGPDPGLGPTRAGGPARAATTGRRPEQGLCWRQAGLR